MRGWCGVAVSISERVAAAGSVCVAVIVDVIEIEALLLTEALPVRITERAIEFESDATLEETAAVRVLEEEA